jgi:hypothetical protein
MIRKAVGMVISRITVAATKKRAIGRLSAMKSTTYGPTITSAATSPTVSRASNGMTVKMTFPGRVSLFHVLPTTVIYPLRP